MGYVLIIDVSDPASPKAVSCFNTKDYAIDVCVSGSHAYVADGDDGLRIIDVSNPSSPREVGYFDTGSYADGVYVSGNYAYVADGWGGLYILRNDLLTGVVDNRNIPEEFSLQQNYPNPFNPSTTIRYSVKEFGQVKLQVFDSLGQVIKTLVNKEQPAGEYTVRWDGRDEKRIPVSDGIYFYRLQIGKGRSVTKRMVLIR